MPENECAEFLSMEHDFGHLSGLLLQAGNHMERYRGRHCSKCSLKTIASVSENDVSLSVSFKKSSCCPKEISARNTELKSSYLLEKV